MNRKIMISLRIVPWILLLACPVKAISQSIPSKPAHIIFDSDMGPDYDDVGAIAILHALADSGQAKILATIASTRYESVAGVLNVFNTYFKKPDIPIGTPKGHGLELRDKQHWTDTLLARYPHYYLKNDDATNAVELYRKILSSQGPHSVTIVTVGFLTNLADLLRSGPDQYSPLNGQDLVKQKVKQLVCMAGRFPSGKEFNVERDAASSKMVFEQWSGPVLLSGFEIGMKIKTGLPLIHNDSIIHSPVKDVFRISIPQSPEDSAGRMSWDETAVLVAIKGWRPWYRIQEGRMLVADDGSDTWNPKGKGHFRLIENCPPEIVQDAINTLIMHQPR